MVVDPPTKLNALRIAIDLYCCLRSAGGGTGAGMSDGEIAYSLGLSDITNLMDLLDQLANQLLAKAGYTIV